MPNAAYNWMCKPPPKFSEDQKVAYIRGWLGEPEE